MSECNFFLNHKWASGEVGFRMVELLHEPAAARLTFFLHFPLVRRPLQAASLWETVWETWHAISF